jgi:Na+/H+-dicarboxylate symporter
MRVRDVILNPWVILACLGSGFLIGANFPTVGLKLSFVGDLYVDLLKMIVLPFMISAIILSLQRLIQEGGTQRILGHIVLIFSVFSVGAALMGMLAMSIARPGENLSDTLLLNLGNVVGVDRASTDTVISLYGTDAEHHVQSLSEVIINLIPSNVFEALAKGEALKALIFAVIFGVALGSVPNRIAGGLSQALETVYKTCETLTRWLSYPLPLVVVCMSASKIAEAGVEPLQAMAKFVLAFSVSSLLLLALALTIIWKRSNASLRETFDALRQPFALAIATSNSATCMPAMIESLVQRLGFARTKVVLLVPLGISLLRVGPMLYYACGAMFIAQLYGRNLSGPELGLLLMGSVLAGFASAGMSSLVTVSLMGMVCIPLGLPFEAVLILFLAIDPICDIFRTLVMMMGNAAAVTLICPRPLKI